MKHTPLTILSVLALALVGCGSPEAQEQPSPENSQVASETPTPEATEATTEPTVDDYLGYLTSDQRDTATDEQLASYEECMTMINADYDTMDMKFDGNEAHHNCITAIEGAHEHNVPDLTEADWENIAAINECAEEIIANDPQVRADLPQEDILEDPTIVYQHPTIEARCM